MLTSNETNDEKEKNAVAGTCKNVQVEGNRYKMKSLKPIYFPVVTKAIPANSNNYIFHFQNSCHWLHLAIRQKTKGISIL
mmetsp:Transcript_5751/g.11482  ORF Transcript_5751/g.11482 Transcript_5751/m.11482 type:complete len:80 (-) Transcript_5751:426-665(-)